MPNTSAVPPDHRSVVLRADGKTMAYRLLGQGPALVCLAGGPGADADSLEDLGGLSADRLLVLPDARGTGRSPPPEAHSGYGFERIAEDVEPLREHVGLERMALLAHSAACTTALVYAADHPERLGALVLVCPSRQLYDEVEDDTGEVLRRRNREPWYETVVSAQRRLDEGPPDDEIPGLLAALAPSYYASWGRREQIHATKMQPANLEIIRWFWRTDVDGDDLRERLGRVEAPVLVVTGELDAATGVNAGEAWSKCFPNGRHVTIPGCGHSPWVDQPDLFATLVTDFLSAI